MTLPISHRPCRFLLGNIQCPAPRALWPKVLAVMEHYSSALVSLKTQAVSFHPFYNKQNRQWSKKPNQY